jgi:NCS1 family nucleobase:cation symporter-1
VVADLLPTPASKRTFAAADFAALWVTLVISITTYYLAASLVDMGEQRQHQQACLAWASNSSSSKHG